MKTTIEMPDDLYKKVKILAIERGETLKDFVVMTLTREVSPPRGEQTSYWKKRKLRTGYRTACKQGAFKRGTDSSTIVSEDRGPVL